jgi:hypothetical protein
LKNHGEFESNFNQAAVEKKINRDVNGKMDIEITKDIKTPNLNLEGTAQSNM